MDVATVRFLDVLVGRATVSGEHASGRALRKGDAAETGVVLVGNDGALALLPAKTPAPYDGVAFARPDGAVGVDAPAVHAPERLPGSAFRPVAETAAFALGRWALAEGRSFTAGPESERHFLVLEGTGLCFTENGDNVPLKAGDLLAAPAGEPAKLWGRSAMSGVVVQPQGAPAPRRTLASELARLRGPGADAVK